ncbi:MAG: valine--tRNA ligase [Candidatus Omnitrophica bacterium CG08_land_8_20_14_0_20_41_16]|uniref:Valine--tRNA ligase n=1 Tax=Candidatus Sherwoodlollariibacterium unditelluris TaxID=1974757 RepID=A0A2G9YIN8_9BACT|nr:MAG: valine--tRNA ligase [Candidatus Omnitrophica bacterium CG23_combo_of_CG06-09_8_20_14_all_41_10]PIS34183.1 MAG: valine--tRNA ligase [Candidatus Omnitrophica bacterium CG08_land_8_20_14_0_20_41_16]
MDEIPKQYSPKDTEEKWYKFWEENNFFIAKPDPNKKPFTIVIPPPNVTGILHMGHALNNTIQDILIRYHRMKGEEALWMPGTDHAGIATQNVVEKSIAKEGLKRQDLGREKFIECVWQWKEQYGSTIIHQLKKLGASCDWPRLRFTMDDEYSKSVIEAFVLLYEKGLIYQGSYIINWCPRCQTALSDEEAAHQVLQGSLYYIKYPLKDVGQFKPANPRMPPLAAPRHTAAAREPANYIVVATTRPETMLGDTAVAVNPKDKRYKKFIGKTLILPLVNREIKIIADSMVDMKFGTGAVKVTPSHDPNDYCLGKKHNLEFINVMRPDARMNEAAGKYQGMDRFKAREVIIEDLKKQGLLQKIEPHELSAGHCYRCHTIIEPYLSKQWFVKMKPLAKPAIEVVKKGKIKFYPRRWTKVYLNWMENIQDWCISRQIWWGHRLPVYYCRNCISHMANSISQKDNKPLAISHKQENIIVSRTKPEKCPKCGSTDIYQDEDVLDTWFSSWLWPFATFGWPNQSSAASCQLSDKNNLKTENRKLKTDLDYFYPTSVLVTAPEIIFFWVARMIMAGLEFQKNIPFKDVYIHGTVRDAQGKKMSKSLGNSIDPLEIISEYGTDALRFSLISITAQGQDVFLSKDRFEQGRNFANKIWNASRFILMNLDIKEFPPKADQPTAENLVNRWILSRFYSSVGEVEKYLNNYQFNEAANTLYSFFWHEFCDWYLELVKPVLVNRVQSTEYRNTQVVMYKVLEKFLRVIHPFMPFITEEIWQGLSLRTCELANLRTSIMIQPWPHIQNEIIDKKTEADMAEVFEVITTIRNMRRELDILSQTQNIAVKIFVSNKNTKLLLESNSACIKNLARLEGLIIAEEYRQSSGEFVNILKGMHLVIPLKGVIDIEKQREKIEDKIHKAQTDIKAKKAMLVNKDFIKRAPEKIVEGEKEKLNALSGEIEKLKGVKNGLK